MPGMRFEQLVDQFQITLERFGATVLREGPVNRRPAKLRVIFGDTTIDSLVFLWTITPGGGGEGVRPAGERRIQITNAEGFPLRPGVRTILGGFSQEDGVWAFWDPRRHSRFSPRSPSLQTNVTTLENAANDGVATHMRQTAGGREVIVAVRPDSLLWYVTSGQPLHNADEDSEAVTTLIEGTQETERDLIDSSESPEQAARRYELVQTMRAYRDARFRPLVLQAYGYRCAISGVALKLVDAAHIVPVSHPRGTDDVTNGIALSRLHHAAFDAGLIGIRSDFSVVMNPEAITRLRDADLIAGLDTFQASLPQRINPPNVADVRPNPEMLRLGMEIRHFPASHVG